MTSPSPRPSDWKLSVFIIGGLIGLMAGLLAAYFFARVSEENGSSGPTRLKTMDMIKLAISVLGLVRQVTDLGTSGKK
ncbi:MAG: hypothetical protein HY866_08400 [Chloroflexi bacterium]|nr:hypothetical protein [Chloroflexota bacterium]